LLELSRKDRKASFLIYVRYLPLYLLYLGISVHSLLGIRAPPGFGRPGSSGMVRPFQWGILERRTRTDFAVHAKMYSKLQKRVKGCTIPILADTMHIEVMYLPHCS
jgi:hypothetical protein